MPDYFDKRPVIPLRLSASGHNSDGGFTLAEILIVTVVLSIMFAVIFAILSGIFRVSEAVESQSHLRGLSQSVFHRLGRELSMITPLGRPILPEPSECGTVRSRPRNLHLLSSPPVFEGDGSFQELLFVARDAGQHFLEGGGNSGFVQIRYFVQDRERRVLVREETPNIRPCETAWERSMSFPLAEGVQSLRFEFYDEEDSQWRDSWTEDQEGRLPVMMRYVLEMSVPVRDRAPRVTTLSSLVPIGSGSVQRQQ